MRHIRKLTLTRHPTHHDLWLTPDGQVYRELSYSQQPNGYPYLRGKPYAKMHRLMLETFRGPSHGRIGLHYDDNEMNWHINNLRWGTLHENHVDGIRNGKMKKKIAP